MPEFPWFLRNWKILRPVSLLLTVCLELYLILDNNVRSAS